VARYYQEVPRKYDENDWALTNGREGGLVPAGFRLHTPWLGTPDLKTNEAVYCIYCLDEMGGIGGGDESFDYCYNCETIMEGEPQVVLDEDEYNYLIQER